MSNAGVHNLFQLVGHKKNLLYLGANAVQCSYKNRRDIPPFYSISKMAIDNFDYIHNSITHIDTHTHTNIHNIIVNKNK